MNRFITFFLVSFILHVAVGAVLLSRTGILGSGGTDAVELNDLEEFPEEAGEAKEDLTEERNPEVLSAPPVPEKPKPRPKVKKKVVKKKVVKKKKVKPKVAKPAPVKKAVPPKGPAPKAVEKALSDEPEKSKAEEASSTKAPKPEEVKTPEAEAKPSDESAEKAKPAEEWVDEDEEVIEETKTPVNDQVKEEKPPESVAPEETEKDSADEGKEKGKEEGKEEKPVPPQNEQEPSSTKSSGSVDKNTPSLDMGKARSHSQLRQVEGNPVPTYPKKALKKKWEGRAEVVYYVNPAGFVEKIQLKHSSGHSVLDNAALRALARYRYYPGQEGWVRHPVEFVLDFDKEVKETAPLGIRESAAQK